MVLFSFTEVGSEDSGDLPGYKSRKRSDRDPTPERCIFHKLFIEKQHIQKCEKGTHLSAHFKNFRQVHAFISPEPRSRSTSPAPRILPVLPSRHFPPTTLTSNIVDYSA